MCFKRKNKKKNEETKQKGVQDIMLPVYLNQRFIYDILATINGGFTEFYEIKDKNEDNGRAGGTVKSSFGTDNSFSLIKTSTEASVTSEIGYSSQEEKNYKKTHTPTSLFMQAYQYLKACNQIKELKETKDMDNIISGDFVELKSSIKLNTMIELFNNMDKVIDLTNVFSHFANSHVQDSAVKSLKANISRVIELLGKEGDKTKYGVCNVGNNEVALKVNKDYFINGDYAEIKNGEFRIIGKVLEIIPEGEKVYLNRDNIMGLYNTEIFEPVKEAAKCISNMNFDEFKDEIAGKTCVIMPVAIGI